MTRLQGIAFKLSLIWTALTLIVSAAVADNLQGIITGRFDSAIDACLRGLIKDFAFIGALCIQMGKSG